jgi:hypothetical protein
MNSFALTAIGNLARNPDLITRSGGTRFVPSPTITPGATSRARRVR